MNFMIGFLLFLSSTSAFAQGHYDQTYYANMKVYQDLFSTDAYRALCENNASLGTARDEVTRVKIGAQIRFAYVRSLLALGLKEQTVTDAGGLDAYLQSLSELDRFNATEILYQNAMKELLPVFSDLDEKLMKSNLVRLKKDFSETIDRLFDSKTSLIRNLQLKARLAEIEILTPQAVQIKDAFTPDSPILHYAFIQGCGIFGNSQNAFAFVNPNDQKRYLLICPGWVLGGVQAGYTELTNYANLLFVVSHELGHHFDSGEFPDLFKNYLSCVATSNAGDLRTPNNNKSILSKLKLWTPEELVTSHAKEITADVWGAEATATYLLSAYRMNPFQAKIDILRETFGALCESGDEGIHPDGRFRANHILSKSTRIRAALGLSPASGGCTW